MIALDASALLAFMFRESSHEQVAEVIEESCLSTVNLAEVLGRFVRDGHNSAAVLTRLQSMAIELVPLSVYLTLHSSRRYCLRPRRWDSRWVTGRAWHSRQLERYLH
jgi:ribonuclease VapC